ncbi:DNA helicase [Ensifer sp.]|jgi:replicative DNA helicase|uniref:DNA helicase n=1 Tax=Ensifer sp. TaxID=1872086 RepID=UPI002E13B3FA|nr:DNA helicase [Ensifer sp.]
MKLSAPIYHLKRKARRLCREASISLHEALDRIAAEEGCASWSLLAAKHAAAGNATASLHSRLSKGDLVLVAARPGQGKTLKSLEFAVDAMRDGHSAWFFTLEYTLKDVIGRFAAIGEDYDRFAGLFHIDCSDAISADYIIGTLAATAPGTLVIVDYLQILDQRRESPELDEQVRSLRAFARQRGLIIVFISQIDRSYDADAKRFPDMRDIRLPNPLDTALFDKACFLSKGEARLQAMR